MPSDRYQLLTKTGRAFDEVSSLLQKSLRRGDIVMAARAANELLPRYANYTWNRLMTVSAEDCADMVTGEVVSLYDAWLKVNESSKDNSKGRVFFAKAIVILARCRHSRDADELNLLIVDRLPDEIFDEALRECEVVANTATTDWEIPAYVYDCHTRRGKRMMGKTKAQFIVEEHAALTNSTTIFRNFDEMAASETFIQPELF